MYSLSDAAVDAKCIQYYSGCFQGILSIKQYYTNCYHMHKISITFIFSFCLRSRQGLHSLWTAISSEFVYYHCTLRKEERFQFVNMSLWMPMYFLYVVKPSPSILFSISTDEIFAFTAMMYMGMIF